MINIIMKKLLVLPAVVVWFITASYAQVSVSNDNSLPDHSAMLEVKSFNKGVLISRLTHDSIAQITNPANGLLVFCTSNNKFYAYDASSNVWREIAYGPGTITPAGYDCCRNCNRQPVYRV